MHPQNDTMGPCMSAHACTAVAVGMTRTRDVFYFILIQDENQEMRRSMGEERKKDQMKVPSSYPTHPPLLVAPEVLT